ncbi:PAS domain-containing sensor histidine kinase [Tetragenococcus halophilus subsp. halophilus DSM 20339]|nr:PAS domain-containing sensor histidine kinase [Tetragenococcus halophilus subsp. halophilus DSM 20339]
MNFKIALTFILVLLVSIEIIGAYFIRGLERSTIDNFKTSMDTQAETLASTLGNHLGNQDDEDSGQQNDELQRVLDNSDSPDVLEMKVVDGKNNIRATTNVAERYTVGKKNDDPYIDDFSTKSLVAVDEESSNRVQINVQPIQTTGDTVGALYIRSDLEQQYEEINDIALIFITSSVIAVFISMIVAVLVARSITQPIGEMRQQALRIAKGDYSRKVQVKGNDELGELAATFNQLGERIEETQEAMESERNRLNSVLSHMTDGVVATDRRGKVITINEMALSLLNVERESAVNQSILTLFDMGEDYTLRKILENPEEILLERPSADKNLDNVLLRVDFSMIRRDSGFISGLVAVLHDVTEQEKTEQERRQFVSNVSHELRTPLTSTRSYIEALSEGAWKDEEIAPKFLNVTLNETDRMIRMINDLLSLSRMDSGNYQLQAEYINFKELVNFVLDRFDMMVDEQEKNTISNVILRKENYG